ncbi:MAG TPA: tetratricopeptide repeat protein [Spirochaetia bacterium]|nr:tetratricopeptide repeat protein [Spirochaetia bacterium]
MYFTHEEVESISLSYGVSRDRRYLGTIAGQIGNDLLQHPDFFRQFGPYWWAVKRLLRRYYRPEDGAGEHAWFLGKYRDRAIERRVALRSRDGRSGLGETWIAALAYLSVQTAYCKFPIAGEADEFIWEDETGEAHFSHLVDSDFPVQLELFGTSPTDPSAEKQSLLDLDGDVCVYVPGTWYNHGNRCLERGEHHEAVACFRKYAALSRTVQDRSQGWLCAGLAYDAAEHYAKAIACYRRCYAVEGAPWVLENIAASYERMGRLGSAKEYYERALTSMPGNPAVAHSLKSVTDRLVRAQ